MEAYLEWERKVDLIFECHDYSEEKKVKLATSEFCDYALTWWVKLVRSRRFYEDEPISTWAEMKRVMRKRFVPSTYTHDVYE